jgi:hypothetical protein
MAEGLRMKNTGASGSAPSAGAAIGNWSWSRTPAQQVRVTGGFNDFDFGYLLKPGESLETPAFYGGFTDQGFGESSRIMHAFEREQILPDRAAPHPRPVLYNSWEATTFNVNEAGQKQLADKAARSAWNCSSWTTAGSASATTITPAWAIGPSIRRNFPTA